MPRFELRGRIGLDGSKWEQGLTQAKQKADTWGRQTAGIVTRHLASGFAVGGIVRGLQAVYEEAARIRDESAKIGVDPETFQHLDYAARQSGATIEDVGRAIKRVATAQLDAVRGSAEYTDAFKRYGVSVENLKQLKPQDIFRLIAEQVERGVNSVNELADLQKLLGRGGPELIPTFKSGLGAAIDESKGIGAAFNAQEVKDLAKASDDLTYIFQRSKVFLARAFNFGVETLANSATGYATTFDPEQTRLLLQEMELNRKLQERSVKAQENIDRNTKGLSE